MYSLLTYIFSMIDIEYNKGELLFEDKERAGHCMDSKWSKSNFFAF
ncbi:hypothetical protein SLGD_01771 [Staphylococcus lugdunensis HKU09-01]|nr:hypothetical protein SLGD_01771 [Staphylococcus lugdunensis HKU09-01]